jgi:hypothetical protein
MQSTSGRSGNPFISDLCPLRRDQFFTPLCSSTNQNITLTRPCLHISSYDSTISTSKPFRSGPPIRIALGRGSSGRRATRADQFRLERTFALFSMLNRDFGTATNEHHQLITLGRYSEGRRSSPVGFFRTRVAANVERNVRERNGRSKRSSRPESA